MTDDARKDAFISIETVHFVDREMEKAQKFHDSELSRLREVLVARFESVAKANDLAYVELQRRLDMLNHAHEEMSRDKEHFLPREVYDRGQSEYALWRDSVNAMLNNFTGRVATWGAVIGIGILLLNHYWK